MGQDCKKTINMCLESVKTADKIVYCDGGSTDSTLDLVRENFPNVNRIHNPYDQQDKQMNGKQRNYYLNYIKKYYPNFWCLALDADEVVEDFSKIKEMIQCHPGGLWSVKMRHLIGDLAHEDNSQKEHYVLNRLFKISDAGKYPEREHPVLSGEIAGITDCTTIWHLAYCPNMWDIKRRYESHLAKSQMHTPEFLKEWYRSHLFGRYPRKGFPPFELPRIILKEFGIDKDELYFDERKNLDIKHFLDAVYLKEFLSDIENPRVIEFGCGMGMRVWAMNKVGLIASGEEISQYAVDNSFIPIHVTQGDITSEHIRGFFDLTMAYDVLEHLKYEDLDKGMGTLLKNTRKYILVSVPYKGTPNCEADPTHIIKEDRDWWISQFRGKGLKLIDTPDHFLFKEQILIFEVRK